ncbi:hypothetical protein GCM10007278_16440 [Paenalcaligenes hominis]|nr:hypothetical protein GCM10007278_16440 [Paenalcaligenes hominis]
MVFFLPWMLTKELKLRYALLSQQENLLAPPATPQVQYNESGLEQAELFYFGIGPNSELSSARK